MQHPKVQVIIPVYNASRYIQRCLDSLLDQTYPYWEAILVDDASNDHSVEIIKTYQEKDSRFVLFCQAENRGVSHVRNDALEKLTETYTAFLDADDFWEKDMLSVMVEKAEEEHADVVQCRFFYDYPGGRQELPKGAFDRDVRIDQSQLSKIFYKMATGINMNHVCMKLIRTDLIKNLRFDTTLRTAEDLDFCVKLFCNVRSYYFINKAFYHYCRYEESLTGKGLGGREKLEANRRVSSSMLGAISYLKIDTLPLKVLSAIRPYTIILSKIFRMIKEKLFSER